MIETLRLSLVRDVRCPTRAHDTDAGIDFYVPNDWNEGHPKSISPGEKVCIPSGVKVDVPVGFALIAYNKSGIASKQGLTKLAEVVDSGYQGEVHLSIANVGDTNVFMAPGMKLLQFLLMPVETPAIKMLPEDKLYSTESKRGAGGFGSTDKGGKK